MIDFRTMRNEEIIRVVRRKLYKIICGHVKHCNDENVMVHILMFMRGVSWATGLRYSIRANGEVYVYLKCLNGSAMEVVEIEYKVINVNYERNILRKSINRHYYKMRRYMF